MSTDSNKTDVTVSETSPVETGTVEVNTTETSTAETSRVFDDEPAVEYTTKSLYWLPSEDHLTPAPAAMLYYPSLGEDSDKAPYSVPYCDPHNPTYLPTVSVYSLNIRYGTDIRNSQRLRGFVFTDDSESLKTTDNLSVWLLVCDVFSFLEQSSSGSRLSKVEKRFVASVSPIDVGDQSLSKEWLNKATRWYNVINVSGFDDNNGLDQYLDSLSTFPNKGHDLCTVVRDIVIPTLLEMDRLCKSDEAKSSEEEVVEENGSVSDTSQEVSSFSPDKDIESLDREVDEEDSDEGEVETSVEEGVDEEASDEEEADEVVEADDPCEGDDEGYEESEEESEEDVDYMPDPDVGDGVTTQPSPGLVIDLNNVRADEVPHREFTTDPSTPVREHDLMDTVLSVLSQQARTQMSILEVLTRIDTKLNSMVDSDLSPQLALISNQVTQLCDMMNDGFEEIASVGECCGGKGCCGDQVDLYVEAGTQSDETK